jgi:hypothetical protein
MSHQALWDYFHENHSLTLLESEVNDILHAVNSARELELQTLRAELAKAQAAVPRWIPVEESLPEPMVDVQVFCPDNPDRGATPIFNTFRNEHPKNAESFFGNFTPVTHWQPLPQPPTPLPETAKENEA